MCLSRYTMVYDCGNIPSIQKLELLLIGLQDCAQVQERGFQASRGWRTMNAERIPGDL